MPCRTCRTCISCCSRIGGLSLILLSNASSTALYSLVKVLEHVTAGHFASIVSFYSICALLPIICFRGDQIFACSEKTLVLLKCVTACLAFITKIWCLKSMHLGDATVLFSTACLFSAFFGRLFLKEKLTVVQILTSIFGITGVVLINKPVFIFSNLFHVESGHSSATGIATSSAMLTGVSLCAERSLLRRYDNSRNTYICSDVQILFYEQILLFVVGWIFDVIIGDPPTLPECGMIRGYFILCSLLVLISLIAMKKGIDKELFGVLIRDLDVILAYIVQILFFGERSDFVTLLGAATIVMCTTAVATNEVIRKARGKVVIPIPPPVIQPKPKPAVQCPEWEYLRDFEKIYTEELQAVPDALTGSETTVEIYNNTTEASMSESIRTEDIDAEDIEAMYIEAEDTDTEDIEAKYIEAEETDTEDIEAKYIEAEDTEDENIEAKYIEAESIEDEDIEAEDIEAKYIEAEVIEPEDIEAEDIEAEDIEAEDNKITEASMSEDKDKGSDEIRGIQEDSEVQVTKAGDTDDEINDIEEAGVINEIKVEDTPSLTPLTHTPSLDTLTHTPVQKGEPKKLSEIAIDPLEGRLDDTSLDDSTLNSITYV